MMTGLENIRLYIVCLDQLCFDISRSVSCPQIRKPVIREKADQTLVICALLTRLPIAKKKFKRIVNRYLFIAVRHNLFYIELFVQRLHRPIMIKISMRDDQRIKCRNLPAGKKRNIQFIRIVMIEPSSRINHDHTLLKRLNNNGRISLTDIEHVDMEKRIQFPYIWIHKKHCRACQRPHFFPFPADLQQPRAQCDQIPPWRHADHLKALKRKCRFLQHAFQPYSILLHIQSRQSGKKKQTEQFSHDSKSRDKKQIDPSCKSHLTDDAKSCLHKFLPASACLKLCRKQNSRGKHESHRTRRSRINTQNQQNGERHPLVAVFKNLRA